MHRETVANKLEPVVSSLTYAQKVYDVLEEAIVTRHLLPGAAISETRLAQQLNVSKTPVREALIRLRAIGLVTEGGRALKVVEGTDTELRNAYEARLALEIYGASLAAQRASTDERRNIGELAHLTQKFATEPPQFRKYDRAFHRAVSEATHNAHLIELTGNALTLVSALRSRDRPTDAYSQACAEQHIAIAEAVSTADSAKAQCRMRQHVLHVMQSVVESEPEMREKSGVGHAMLPADKKSYAITQDLP